MTLVSFIEGGRQAVEQGDDPRIGVSGGQGMETFGLHADANGAQLSQRASGSGIELTAGRRIASMGDDVSFAKAQAQDTRVEQHFHGSLQPGRAVTLEKFVAYTVDGDATTRERPLAGGAAGSGRSGLRQTGGRSGRCAGRVLASRGAVHRRRRGDRTGAAFQSVPPAAIGRPQRLDGTAAKGLTGEGYEGHCFWDTEAFVLPVMAFTAPEVARAMLLYRYRTLEARARMRAR